MWVAFGSFCVIFCLSGSLGSFWVIWSHFGSFFFSIFGVILGHFGYFFGWLFPQLSMRLNLFLTARTKLFSTWRITTVFAL